MTPEIQWAITLIVAILTFFAGQYSERRKIAQTNRLKLIEPIDEWARTVNQVMSIMSITIGVGTGDYPGDHISHQIYDMMDRIEIGKSLSENRLKILGTLTSAALKTNRTENLCNALCALYQEMGTIVETQMIPLDIEVNKALQRGEDTKIQARALLNLHNSMDVKLTAFYGRLAELKVQLA